MFGLRRLAIFVVAAMALSLACVQPASAQRQSRDVAAYMYKAEQTLAAYRRQSDEKLTLLRRQISNRDSRIGQLRAEIRAGSAQARRLEGDLAKLEEENAAQQLEFTERLASLEAKYSVQYRTLLNNGTQLSSTPEGQEVLRLFNEGSPDAWEKAKEILGARKLTRRQKFAAEARAEAGLYYEKIGDGQETIATVIELYEEVIEFDDEEFGDHLRLADLYYRSLRLLESYQAAARALEVAKGDAQLALAAMTIGRTAMVLDDREFAERSFATAVDASRRFHRQTDAAPGALLLLQEALATHGYWLAGAGRREEGIAQLQEARGLVEAALADDPQNTSYRQARAAIFTVIAGALDPAAQGADAAAYLDQALLDLHALGADFPDSIALKSTLWNALATRGGLHEHAGEREQADGFYARLLPLAEEVLAADEQSGPARLMLARSHLLAGHVARRAEQLDEARGQFGRAAVAASAIGMDFPNVEEAHEIGFAAMIAFGDIEALRGQPEGVELGYTSALEMAQAAIDDAALTVENGGSPATDLEKWWAARGLALSKMAEAGVGDLGWRQAAENFDRMEELGFAGAIDQALRDRASAELAAQAEAAPPPPGGQSAPEGPAESETEQEPIP